MAKGARVVVELRRTVRKDVPVRIELDETDRANVQNRGVLKFGSTMRDLCQNAKGIA